MTEASRTGCRCRRHHCRCGCGCSAPRLGRPRRRRPSRSSRSPSCASITPMLSSVLLAATTTIILLTTRVRSMTAHPTRSFRRYQPDGSRTPPLYLKGDHRRHRMVDGDGREVVRLTADDADAEDGAGSGGAEGERGGAATATAAGKAAEGGGGGGGWYVYRDDGTVFGSDGTIAMGGGGGGTGSGSSAGSSTGGYGSGSEAPMVDGYGYGYDGVLTRAEAEEVLATIDGLDDHEYDDEEGTDEEDDDDENDDFLDIDVHSWPPADDPQEKGSGRGPPPQLLRRRRTLEAHSNQSTAGQRKRSQQRRRRRRRLRASDLPPHRRHLTGPHLSEYVRHLRTRRHLQAATSSQPAVLRCLVVLIRFANHRHNRALPQPAHFRHFFSSEGGHPQFAPTGSVADWYRENSGGKFQLEATVSEWIDLPETESWYANGNWGWNEPRMQQGFYTALTALDTNVPPNHNFPPLESFDNWSDGIFDAVCFVHSGIPAEWGDTDCSDGADQYSRIWSHKSWGQWQSRSGKVRLNGYFVGSAVWPYEDKAAGCLRCDDARTCDIARIGVFAHELMHDLGMPDMYDGHEGGLGVGNYDCMGNSWGWDAEQRYPPNLSPWTKDQLWWATKVTISAEGIYQLPSTASSDEIYCIEAGYPAQERLCCENRYPEGYDRQIPGEGGMACWHIDDKSWHHTQGYPGMSGWPQNGAHYRVALLGADGSYDLETAANFGDARDLFRPNLVGASSVLGPDGIAVLTSSGTAAVSRDHPNTDAYQGGVIRSTGVKVEVLSDPGPILSVRITGGALSPAASMGGLLGDATAVGDDGGMNSGQGNVNPGNTKENSGSNGNGGDLNTANQQGDNGSERGGGGGGCATLDKEIYVTRKNRKRGTTRRKKMNCSEVKRRGWCSRRKFNAKLCPGYCKSGCSGNKK